MKPAPFEYSRPADIDEACALLAADDGARVIAGGQTLVPLMAMRLARPTRLIDIARIPGLAYIRDEGSDHRDRRHHQAACGRERSGHPDQAAAARQGHALCRAHARRGRAPVAFDIRVPPHRRGLRAAAADDGARVIAGGQTLVPLMAMRLARPSRLIDIARIPGLAYVRDEGDEIAIGATTRQHVVESDPVVRAKLPLLAKVMPFVGHTATRARGTVGGSLVNGDPAAEIVLVAVTLGATLVWRDGGESNRHRGVGFLPRADGDGAAADRLPRRGALSGLARAARRRGLPRDQRAAERFRLCVGRGADRARCRRPLHARGDRHRRRDRRAAAARWRGGSAARASASTKPRCATSLEAALADIEAMADLHASAEYRKRVAVTLAVRAIADAYQDAARRA